MSAISRILVVIPCFNESENVKALYDALCSARVPGCSITPLFVNDGSTDRTRDVLELLDARFLDNTVNIGIGGTVQLGFIYALENGFDFAVQVDGDGQHPPGELAKLLQPLLSGQADVAIGSRFIENQGFRSTFLRRLGIRLFHWLNKALAGIRITDATSGFRAYNRKALEQLVVYYPDEYPEPEAVLYMAHRKLRIREVPVIMDERRAGVSSIRRLGSLYYMGKVMLNTLFLHVRMKNE